MLIIVIQAQFYQSLIDRLKKPMIEHGNVTTDKLWGNVYLCLSEKLTTKYIYVGQCLYLQIFSCDLLHHRHPKLVVGHAAYIKDICCKWQGWYKFIPELIKSTDNIYIIQYIQDMPYST